MYHITDHFQERCEERYNTNKSDKLELVVERFKKIQKEISKKKRFYKITSSINKRWEITYKLYDQNVVYMYAKWWWDFWLISLWDRHNAAFHTAKEYDL